MRRCTSGPERNLGRVPAQFSNDSEHVAFMEDPSRILCLEWRRQRRRDSGGMLSHSLLEASLLDASRVRFEKLADCGLLETVFPPGDKSVKGELYRGRKADEHKLVRPVKVHELRCLATSLGELPYSVQTCNCHHFVRDLWNSMVIKPMRRQHYPDRVASSMLRGLSLPFSNFVARSAAHLACLDGFPADDESSYGGEAGVKESGEKPCTYPHLTVVWGEFGRISGVYAALAPGGAGYNSAVRLRDGAKFIAEGSVALLEAYQEPVILSAQSQGNEVPLGQNSQITLLGVDQEDAQLSQRICITDATELAARLPPPGAAEPLLAQFQPNGTQQSPNSKQGALVSSLSSGSRSVRVIEPSFIIMRSSTEIRLAIFGIVKADPMHGGPDRRLRMLSGDVRQMQSSVYAYSLGCLQADLHQSTESRSTVLGLQAGELDALRAAVATSDWAFATLL